MLLKQLRTTECINHPLFWRAKDRFLYISELVRAEKHIQLPMDATLGIRRDSRTQLHSGLLFEHMRTSKDRAHYGSHPRELLRMLQNFYQHPPHLEGDDPITEAAEELKRLPGLLLFLSLYWIFGNVCAD
jgi:hypothetical protein